MLLLDLARFLIETATLFLGVTLLLRAYLGWVGMPGRNPLAQFAFALTEWLVRPLRVVVPVVGRWDLPALLGAYLVSLLALLALAAIIGGLDRTLASAMVFAFALGTLLRWALYMVFMVVLLHALLSWVNPFAPLAPALAMLARPFLAPFRKIIPAVGGVDLSPLALIVVVNLLLIVLARTGL